MPTLDLDTNVLADNLRRVDPDTLDSFADTDLVYGIDEYAPIITVLTEVLNGTAVHIDTGAEPHRVLVHTTDSYDDTGIHEGIEASCHLADGPPDGRCVAHAVIADMEEIPDGTPIERATYCARLVLDALEYDLADRHTAMQRLATNPPPHQQESPYNGAPRAANQRDAQRAHTTTEAGAAMRSIMYADTGDLNSRVSATVPGRDNVDIYAHPSQTVDGAVMVGVDAPEGQRILVAVNDADLLDTTIGNDAGAHTIDWLDASSHDGAPSEEHSTPDGPGLVVTTRCRFRIPDTVMAAGPEAAYTWLQEQARTITAAYPVELDVYVGSDDGDTRP
ncbi:MAG: hypothetical protein L0H59_07000 [Tomitella sp.]|nr:hypothetical protein [Tomitella sp.]